VTLANKNVGTRARDRLLARTGPGHRIERGPVSEAKRKHMLASSFSGLATHTGQSPPPKGDLLVEPAN